ncbi:hypothetical protein llap_6541 [Limosa lapponica baueri]|uniref:Uncharacterized protein n=1 Tax=Limosa lapponica baueri TaxID=1758121 RepID=A0A2I0UAP8_LIMLA|nr:hypothetical protein llap_6541 [Limosa lapponica baueri]
MVRVSGGSWVPVLGRGDLLGSQTPTDGPLEEIPFQDRRDWLEEPQAESFKPGRRWMLSNPGGEQWVANCSSSVVDDVA